MELGKITHHCHWLHTPSSRTSSFLFFSFFFPEVSRVFLSPTIRHGHTALPPWLHIGEAARLPEVGMAMPSVGWRCRAPVCLRGHAHPPLPSASCPAVAGRGPTRAWRRKKTRKSFFKTLTSRTYPKGKSGHFYQNSLE